MKPIKFLGTFAAMGILATTSANAALTALFSTNFNSPTYSDAALNVGTDTTTPGVDGWLSSSGGGTNNISVANSATNGTVTLTTSGQDIRHPFAAVAGSGASVYLKADITVTSAGTGDYFLHLGDGGTGNFYARTYVRSATGGFQMALGTSSGTPVNYGTTVLTLGTTYTVLLRYDLVSGLANDTGALFINPTTEDGSGDTAYVAATTTGTDATSIAGVYLRQGGAASSPGVTIDNIVVSSIPEPASALLGALGLIAMLRRRR